MNKISLRSKLITSFLLAGLIPLITVGFYSYNRSVEALQKKAVDKLVAVRNIKGAAIKRYFNSIRSQVLTFSETVSMKEAMRDFNTAFNSFNSETGVTKKDLKKYRASLKSYYQNKFGAKYKKENGFPINTINFLNQLSETETALQYHYISANPKPFGQKEELDAAPDRSTYSKIHAKHHPSIRSFLKEFGYYDIFLIDIKSGHIVYSVFKELDFATSLTKGPYRDTNIAEAFRRAKKITDPKGFVLVDYKKYTPSFESPASFIAAPIWDKGKKIGIAMFQMPIDRLNAIMGERSGMGKTGETYLVGPDQLMRSDSFNDSKNYSVVSSFKNAKTRKSSSQSVEGALKGESGDKIDRNYLDQEVITAFTPIDILGLQWALIADLSTTEAFKSAIKIRNALMLMIGITFIMIIVFAFFLSSTISNKIHFIANEVLSSAKEVGASSDNISSISTKLSEASLKTSTSLQETVSSIDEISSMVQNNADATNRSKAVSSRSHEVANIGKQKVESMMSSINEISKSNEDIATEMQNNSRDISEIVRVISEIGEKTKVINDIVFQTKLLSFNASVEAARAGEHGKGFAVVAEEIGSLASMSGKAAQEISGMLSNSTKQVTEIIENTKSNVEKLIIMSRDKIKKGNDTAKECELALDEILQNVASVNDIVLEIANASSEQATGVKEVNKLMREIDSTTHENTSNAHKTSSMAQKLNDQSIGLSIAVDGLFELINGKKNESHSNDLDYTPESENGEVIAMPNSKKIA